VKSTQRRAKARAAPIQQPGQHISAGSQASRPREPGVPEGGLKNVGHGTYSNWNGLVRFAPRGFAAPESIAELQDLIKRSSRVRLVGSAHSMNSAMAADADTILIQMNNINRVGEAEQDANGDWSVWVEGGATLGDIAAILSSKGLALSTLPQSPKITLGGMIANGVHGSSYRESAVVAEQVTELEVVTSSGEQVAVATELLPFARVGLGSLGAVVRVKLRVVPNFDLVSSSETLPGSVALSSTALLADLNAHDFQLSYTYDPIAKTVTRRTLDRAEPPQAHKFGKLTRKTEYDENRFESLTGLALTIGAHLPNAILGLRDKLKRRIREAFMKIEPRIGESRFMFQTNLGHPAHDMAYAVPVARCRELLEKIADEFDQMGYEPDLPLGMRFLKSTDAVALAINSGQDVAIIEWASLVEFDDSNRAFETFERILHKAGGRPHWGKEFSFNPKSVYPKESWYAFAELSARWGWKFVNEWSQHLTPAGDAKHDVRLGAKDDQFSRRTRD
jgi:FAD/FMN-containing dehydrogenase